jgi:hypothetical protein
MVQLRHGAERRLAVEPAEKVRPAVVPEGGDGGAQ